MKSAVAAMAFLPVFLWFSFSCSKSDDGSSLSTPGLPNVILPLQVGNYWRYQTTSYDTAGSIIALDTITQRIVRDTIISGERWYVWQTPASQPVGTLRSDGYWSFAEGAPALFFAYPASVNQTYMITEDGPTVRVLAVDTLIAIPPGTFPCTAYEQRDSRSGERLRIDYLAANTGLIRTEEYIHLAGGADSVAQRSDLIDIHLY